MHRSISAVVVGASLIAACGGDDAVSIDGLADFIIATECGIDVTCNAVSDETTCKSGFQLMGNNAETIIADVKSGIVLYDPAKAKSCFDAAKARGCSFEGLHTDPADPCNDYLTGTVAVGGACFYSQECAAHGSCSRTVTTCDPNTACCTGTCAANPNPISVALGGACSVTSQCPINGYCKGATSGMTNGVCTAVVTTAGAVCDDLFACANNMICNMTSATAGTCYQPGATDGACDPTFFANEVACSDDRQYCDAASMKCIARVAVGATCSADILCERLAECVGTKCVANGSAGTMCDSQNGPGCNPGLSCTNSKCTLPPTGANCR